LDLRGLVHDMIVRENVSLFVDDHTRAQAALGSGSGKSKKRLKKS
jgi:hypothetical protein